MSGTKSSNWPYVGHTTIRDILHFDSRSQSLCVVQLNGNPPIAGVHCQLPTIHICNLKSASLTVARQFLPVHAATLPHCGIYQHDKNVSCCNMSPVLPAQGYAFGHPWHASRNSAATQHDNHLCYCGYSSIH